MLLMYVWFWLCKSWLLLQVGIGIKPGTHVDLLEPYLDKIDTALVMTVEPGFGGQSFMHDMMSKASGLAKTSLQEIPKKVGKYWNAFLSAVHCIVDAGMFNY